MRTCLLLLEPIGLVWLTLLGLIWALWRRRQRRLALVPALLAALLYLVGSTGLPDRLLRSLERPYIATDLAAVPTADAVVVLGGGLMVSRYEVGHLHLTTAGDRLIMALEMIRLGKAPVLVCGGGRPVMEDVPF